MLKREDLKVGETYQDTDMQDCTRRVYFIGDEKIFYIWKNANTGEEEETVMRIDNFLKNNKLIKPEPKIEILYECVESNGNLALYFEDGYYPNFNKKEKSVSTFGGDISRKTGRTFKLNMETWEIVE